MLAFSRKREESGELEMDEWLAGRPTTDVLSYYVTASLTGDKELLKYTLKEVAWRPDLKEVTYTIKADLLDPAVVKPWVLTIIYAILDMWRRSGSLIDSVRSLDRVNNLDNAVRFIASTNLPNCPTMDDRDVGRVSNYLRYICNH